MMLAPRTRRVRWSARLLAFSVACCCAAAAPAQTGPGPIRTFGYFQVQFRQDFVQDAENTNTFSVQQLNLFFQKDLARDLTALIDFEVLNSFSSDRQWGAFNLEEAWVGYFANRAFHLRLGLLKPAFNGLNEIKNQTPLLPYIVRPLVYESSFRELIGTEEYVPERAYIQASGWLPLGRTRFEYVAYLGNSPGIASRDEVDGGTTQIGLSGADTSDTFLIGGRVGIGRRYLDPIRVGVSVTNDRYNGFRVGRVGSPNIPQGSARITDLLGVDPEALEEVGRTRLGADATLLWRSFTARGEWIGVQYDDGRPDLNFNLNFAYGTLEYQVDEALGLYATYWYSHERIEILGPEVQLNLEGEVDVYGVGAAYDFAGGLRGKVQYARPIIDNVASIEGAGFGPARTTLTERQRRHILALAVSVSF